MASIPLTNLKPRKPVKNHSNQDSDSSQDLGGAI